MVYGEVLGFNEVEIIYREVNSANCLQLAFVHRNVDLLKDLLIELLDLNLDRIKTSINLLSISLPPSTLKEYLKTVDFNILLNDNIIINLEFNNMTFSKVKMRNYIYLCKLMTSLLKSGSKINELKQYKVYQVNVNASNGGVKCRKVKNLYLDNYKEYINNVKIVEINLESFKELLYTEYKDASKIDYILASFKTKNIFELDNILKKYVSNKMREKIIKEVMIIMQDFEMVFTEEEVRAMDKMIMDGYLEELEEKKQAALKEGQRVGMQQGIQQGMKQSKIEIAKKLLTQKISIDVIKNATGLSDKTIKNLML